MRFSSTFWVVCVLWSTASFGAIPSLDSFSSWWEQVFPESKSVLVLGISNSSNPLEVKYALEVVRALAHENQIDFFTVDLPESRSKDLVDLENYQGRDSYLQKIQDIFQKLPNKFLQTGPLGLPLQVFGIEPDPTTWQSLSTNAGKEPDSMVIYSQSQKFKSFQKLHAQTSDLGERERKKAWFSFLGSRKSPRGVIITHSLDANRSALPLNGTFQEFTKLIREDSDFNIFSLKPLPAPMPLAHAIEQNLGLKNSVVTVFIHSNGFLLRKNLPHLSKIHAVLENAQQQNERFYKLDKETIFNSRIMSRTENPLLFSENLDLEHSYFLSGYDYFIPIITDAADCTNVTSLVPREPTKIDMMPFYELGNALGDGF